MLVALAEYLKLHRRLEPTSAVSRRHFLEAVIKTKLANILSNQDESDVAFDVGVACIC